MSAVALIVGSGFSNSKLDLQPGEAIDTPFGSTTSPLLLLSHAGMKVPVIARHGLNHDQAPHAVNYRANIWALKELGVRYCLALNIVGGINAELSPGTLAVPHQLIDYSYGRDSSFASAATGVVHAEFTEPFSPVVRDVLEAACQATGQPIHRGVYAVSQGPRLETAAEIDRLERDGCGMVGMTAMPEAVLAREADIEYAILAGVVNYAAGRAPQGQSIHAQMAGVLESVMTAASAVLLQALATLAQPRV